jgi:aspartyl-tRNA(Asn)/glutamyl-tRNA(Gln) amidotransferase subunit A
VSDDIFYLRAHELSKKIHAKQLSPVEVTGALLNRIESLNDKYLAFLTVTGDLAMAAAKKAETEIAQGRSLGPLHGVPYGAKDIIDTAGVRTTMGSSFHRENVPTEDAECIRRLKDAGAIMLGKTHTHEFAAASTTINPHWGTCRNPWNPERIVGGSSGGSAAAVAAGMVPMAIGTDTGGSIRTPSAFCGGVGFKPTHGRVSIRGICPNVLSLDHAGPMTRSARDAAMFMNVLAGHDPLDSKTRNVPVPDYMANIEKGVKGSRIFLCPDYYSHTEVDAEVQATFDAAAQVFRDLGANVEEVSFPNAHRFIDLFPSVSGPEFAEFHRPFYEKNPDGYGQDVRERVEWSLEIPLDNYVRALRERVLLRREAMAFLMGADALITPSAPCAAPPIKTLMAEINGRDVRFKNLHRPFLSSHNITGCPSLAVPTGLNKLGLPLSMNIAAAPWREADVLRIAHAYETATPEIRALRPPVG